MKKSLAALKMAELARLSGTSRSTIHHYENLGLLPEPDVRGPKLHLFGPEHVARLREIKRLRAQGLSLRAIKPMLVRTPARSHARDVTSRDSTRVRILTLAAQAFVSFGYERMRLDDLAAELHMAKATIYRHFPSKQALFLECVEAIRFTLVPETARHRSEQQESLEAHGRDRARAVLERFPVYRGLAALLGSLVHDADPVLSERAKHELHGMITNAEPFLRKLRSAERIRPLDTELLAYMLWGALMGAGDRLTLDRRYTQEQVLEAYLDFVAHGTEV